ncbi:MAG: AAC(3) family N-acetyltransferase [Eubacteriales bacterium]|jgi:aminoglycoside 3-N-acetyltransferase
MTLDTVCRLLEDAVDGEEIRTCAREYRQFPLKLSYSSYAQGIEWLCARYTALGLDAEVLHFPADGETVYADRHFPLAWDVDEAWAEVDGERIADYAQNSYGVVPFSADSGGVCEKILLPQDVLPEHGPLDAYAALICRFPEAADVRALTERGCRIFLAAVDLDPIHPSLDDSRRWYNNLFGAGQIDRRDTTCVGFSLSPRIARMLVKRCSAGETRVRYLMKTRTYAGDAPAVTALIPGQDEHSFLITAHAYEPHATNNVAGVASSLAAAKALSTLINTGVLPRPRHGIRFFHGFENFSLYAWGMANREQLGMSPGGVSIDSFGRMEAGGRTERFVLRRCLNVHPSNQHALAREVLERVCSRRGVGFEVRESSSNNEELMQDPGFGPPWNLLYGSLWEEPRETYPRCYFYHTSVDDTDALSPQMLSAAAVFAAALAYVTAADDSDELPAFAEKDWQRIVAEKCREALRLTDTDEAPRLLRAQRLAAWRDLSIASGTTAIGDPIRAAAFRAYTVRTVGAALTVLCGGEPPKLPRPEGCTAVLRRVIPGPLGLGTIDEPLRALAEQSQGYYAREYWCLDPSGANLYHFDGHKDVWEVARALWATRAYKETEREDDLTREVTRTRILAQVLEEGGLAVRVPETTREDIIAGLRALGLRAGDTVMVHSSLKAFGRVEGGADTVVDALLEVITETGIVAMPAFTDCTGGAVFSMDMPAEPWIGAVAEAFRKRPGTCRSSHPTHSVCARGTHAAAFLAQKDPYDCFAPDGAWAKLRDGGGKLVFLGETVGANTFLHACEAWYNRYLDETMAAVRTPSGDTQVRVTNYPGGCRGGWYKLGRTARYYQKLLEYNVPRTVRAGEATLTVMDAGALARTMRELFASEPDILLHKSGCSDCARLRAKL